MIGRGSQHLFKPPMGVFDCSRRNAAFTEYECHDGFLIAHAHEDAKHPCWGCPRGAVRRIQAALRATEVPSEIAVANMLWHCGYRPDGYRRKPILAEVKSSDWWKRSLTTIEVYE